MTGHTQPTPDDYVAINRRYRYKNANDLVEFLFSEGAFACFGYIQACCASGVVFVTLGAFKECWQDGLYFWSLNKEFSFGVKTEKQKKILPAGQKSSNHNLSRGENRTYPVPKEQPPRKLSGFRTHVIPYTLERGVHCARRRDNDLRRKDRRGIYEHTECALNAAVLFAQTPVYQRPGGAMTDLRRTPLFDLHVSLGAKMVPFAGYDMPVNYKLGVMKEHQHTRRAAGLFDVSHMGQVILRGRDADAAALALETILPQDIIGLPVGRQRYAFFTNDAGGIEDDLMVANRGDHLFVVVNAACKDADVARMRAALEPQGVTVKLIENRALLALQGPMAESVLADLQEGYADLRFMDVATLPLAGAECWVSRSGYTGEDGFEISIPASAASDVAKALLADARVEAIGLGARDSLRLEAGLCLYGHDIDTSTSPVEAGLTWAIQKVRRTGGTRAGGFPGEYRIFNDLAEGAARKRVGLRPEGRAPMREGTPLFASDTGGDAIGRVTSGGFGPTVGAPVAMGYIASAFAIPDQKLFGEVRGKRHPVRVNSMPFVPAGFKR